MTDPVNRIVENILGKEKCKKEEDEDECEC